MNIAVTGSENGSRRTLGALRDSIFGLALEPLIDSFFGAGEAEYSRSRKEVEDSCWQGNTQW